MSGDDESPDTGEVGYGRPPKEHQFKKGKSGNPNGRPPKKAAASTPASHWGISTGAIGRLAYEPVTAMLNGKPTEITLIEAVHRRRLADAAKGGNRLLQREVIAETNTYEKGLLQAEVERFYYLRDKKSVGQALIADARARGRPEPDLLPHPDDIIIDEDEYTATVDGPETRIDKSLYDFRRAFRDHFVIRAAYQKRYPPLLRPFTEKDLNELREIAEAWNDGLNARLRWGPCGFSAAMRPYEGKGLRFLEADLEKSLATLERIWSTEPALEPLRKKKKFADEMAKVVRFSTRSRERRKRQWAYDRYYEMLRQAYGDEAMVSVPKRFSERRDAELQASAEALSPEQRARVEKMSAVLCDLVTRV